MSQLFLPPHVIAAQRRAFEAKVLRCVTIEDARAREYTHKLQRISPDMFMVRAQDTVDADLPLRPGFYHILVRNPDAPMTVMTVHENGEYAEPDSRIFDVLARGNLRERRVRDRLAEQERQEQEEVEKERLEGQERRLEKARDIVNSATRAQVSMDRSIPWTQNSQGRRER
jgi:hypothetical protein